MYYLKQPNYEILKTDYEFLGLHEGTESTNYEIPKTDYEFLGLHENAARSDCRSVGFVIRPGEGEAKHKSTERRRREAYFL